MKSLIAMALVALLAACGVDGEPIPPTRAKAAPSDGIRISGEARVGVVKTF
ncbi:argininosuccinate lyase [Pseudooceanicola sp.]|uniref:argininosuccinate lyase n=1 Tax=Pseudooceanicola sp. TaxID=1914328 RepID=UPI0026322AA9|nr:argininosuccinate lyase [Pseudooceanicola sp.]MDF1855313.1 argininosuccinate lyase [Pseudooceanicola sp.]